MTRRSISSRAGAGEQSRWMLSVTLLPGAPLSRLTAWCRESPFSGLSSMACSTSPGRKPAASAGPPAIGETTTNWFARSATSDPMLATPALDPSRMALVSSSVKNSPPSGSISRSIPLIDATIIASPEIGVTNDSFTRP
jgi:hypothetical protein